jgi:hypothetical protein
MSIIRRLLFTILCVFVLNTAFSQVSRSPYSTFGIGETFTNALASHQGMGGIGAAQPQYWYAATINPALLVYNNQVMFSAGMIAESKKITSDTLTEETKAGNLNYLVAAFPLMRSKRDARYSVWTTSLSLMPFTSVRYNAAYEDQIGGSTETVQVIEKGTGGTSQLTWANGVRINNELALGLKASYFFGSTVNTYQNRLTNSASNNLYAALDQKYYVKDFGFTAGLSWSKDSLFSRQKYRVSFGVVYDFATDLKTKRQDILYRSNNVGDKIEVDTLTTARGFLSIPSSLTVGAALSRANWSFATEFTMRDWSQFKSFEREDEESYGKSWRYAIGSETTPDGYSESFLKRMTYRLGFSYEQTPYRVQTDGGMNSVKDVGVNVGLSIPTGRWSSIDLGLRYGKRGDKQETIFEETYYRVFFGVSFNDKEWFIKRKFD